MWWRMQEHGGSVPKRLEQTPIHSQCKDNQRTVGVEKCRPINLTDCCFMKNRLQWNGQVQKEVGTLEFAVV